MEIWNCEFCKAYVTNFEVHYCRNFGNQHHQSSATLPLSSSANWVQDIDSRSALPMNYDAGWPAMGQINSSTQQSFLPVMHQQTYCEEMSAAEMVSEYGVTYQNPYNPETSDILFPGRPPIEENESKSIYLQHTTGASNVIEDQNYQYHDALIPEHITMSIADRNFLPDFQQTYGQINTPMNRMFQHPTAPYKWNVLEYFAQMKCHPIFHPPTIISVQVNICQRMRHRDILEWL
ncbi:hypothetical protein CDAR_455341 [Caerostris darwini]|uniref:Uncharacterized protein n=1 Tax=Caerostris darwini TaxID=1538125 RepID=A0AAV4TLY8_9ARAC|nr:hypothetical protein CDAR_455341 [Caerostris darwini]